MDINSLDDTPLSACGVQAKKPNCLKETEERLSDNRGALLSLGTREFIRILGTIRILHSSASLMRLNLSNTQTEELLYAISAQ